MIHVEFDPETLSGSQKDWWERWKRSADSATQKVIADITTGDHHEYDSRIWSSLKEFLLEHVFHGKCAYCESYMEHTSFGDAEHYRPKGKITVKKAGINETIKSGDQAHPGYFWLAYEWSNLLPACQRCNSSEGKMNQFPVARSHTPPDMLMGSDALDALEQPLLLHPYRDDPRAHLAFGKKGVVAAKHGSARGKTSIEVYWLDRSALATERQRAQELGWSRFMRAADSGGDIGPVMAPYLKGMEPHSSAVIDYIRLRWKEVDQGW